MTDVIYEKQRCDISWYANPIGPEGTAKDNFERIIELRKAFCHPLTIHPDGTLNDKYFSTTAKETAVNWTDIETLQLYEGIFKYGVDSVEKWIQIKNDFLPQRDFIEVRLKLSQLLGVQDLSIYKGRKFESEKEIKEECIKNKEKGIKDQTWRETCGVALKPEVASLTADQVKALENKELHKWNKHVYNNPTYIYRPHTKQTRESSDEPKSTSNKKKQTKNTKNAQKNTLDAMLKKKEVQKDDAEVTKEVKATEPLKEVENVVDTKPKKKATKKKKKAAKGVPLMPESSDDEDMLCVE